MSRSPFVGLTTNAEHGDLTKDKRQGRERHGQRYQRARLLQRLESLYVRTGFDGAILARFTGCRDRPSYDLAMAVTYVFAGIPVADRDAAVGWYERLVGRPPDLLPNDHEAAWRLTETGWIYVIVDAGRAGSALNTLLVDDLDGFLAELAKRSVEAGPVETIGSGVRVTVVTDPDGNRLQVGQPPT